jgi:hypothetical protein
MQYVNARVLMGAIMFEIRVYYHDVLRYTISGHWDKVQELRNKGFNVQVKEAPGQGLGLGGWCSPRSLPVNGGGDVIVLHDVEFGVHKLAEVRPDAEHHTLGFY